MKKEINMLIFHLRQETKLFSELKQIINQQRNAILDKNIEKLNEITRIEENLLIKIKKEEDQRQGLSKIIASMLDLNNGKITISKIINKAPQNLKEALSQEKDDLKVLMSQISVENQKNNRLLKDNLEFISYEMQALGDLQEAGSYSPGKRNSKPALLNRLI